MRTCKIEGIGGKRNKEDAYKAVKLFYADSAPKIKKPRKERKIETVKRDMSEKKLEMEIIFDLKSSGYEIYKTGQAGAYDYNTQFNIDAISDLIVIGKSGVHFLEVKIPEKRNWKDGGLTGKQPKFRDFCISNGLSYAIVYSKEEAYQKVSK